MNRFLVTVALVIGVSGPAFAQDSAVPAGPQQPAPSVEQPTGVSELPSRIESDSEEQDSSVETPASTSESPSSEDEAKKRIKLKVLEIVETALDSADVDLSKELKEEIEQEFEDKGRDGLVVDMGPSEELENVATGGLAVGALAIVVIFGTPMMIVAAVLYAGYRKRRLVHDTINQYLASGKEVPPEIIKHLQAPETPKNYLQKGLVWSGVGLGIILCFMVLGETEGAAIGFIPLFIGLAQLLIWKLEQRGTGARE
ncbi:MAG: DUF6249 domain-containing protein [Gammaproteobacteria bacterium]